jgi:sterol desaturase/sphingolipid hydroxylase (fatty acid hydroxylase superfamily)
VIDPAGAVADLLGKAAPVLGAFLLVAAVEIGRPWRAALTFSAARWLNNLALLTLTAGADYLTAPVVAFVASKGFESWLPLWAQLVIGIPALDAVNYGLHRGFHASSLLWRLHALHHADPELDVTTTVRHHPAEALLMGFVIGGFGGGIGLSPLIVALYGSLNLCLQFFAHGNIGLPRGLASALGWLVVTPDLHRVHHSRYRTDFDANFGVVFSLWDRLFATFRGGPQHGEPGFEFGIDRFREQYYQRLDRMLWLPVLIRADE